MGYGHVSEPVMRSIEAQVSVRLRVNTEEDSSLSEADRDKVDSESSSTAATKLTRMTVVLETLVNARPILFVPRFFIDKLTSLVSRPNCTNTLRNKWLLLLTTI